jgi:hypothetical protein
MLSTDIRMGTAMGYRRTILLLLATGIVALLSTKWVGGVTIYADGMEAKRLFIHEAVLKNRLPEGRTWESYGANSFNIRIAVPYAVEAIHRLTGMGVLKIYRLIDLVCIFVFLNLYFLYLRHWFDWTWCAMAMLFIAALLPMTYLFHFFHGWDRPSCVLWIVLLTFLRDRRLLLFTVVLVLSVFVKFDTILLPLLYWLCLVTPARFWRTSLEAAGLFALTFGIYYGLQKFLPGGAEPRDLAGYVTGNTRSLLENHVAFPPLLMFSLPALLAILGWKRGDRFQRAAALFTLPMIAVLYVMTIFIEVRAEMPLFFLLSPLAIAGLQRATEPGPATA